MTVIEAQLAIKSEIKEMQRASPSLSFKKCWTHLQRRKPELFREEDQTDSRAGADSSFYYKQAIGVIHAERATPYIELLAEDAIELERQVSAGLWD